MMRKLSDIPDAELRGKRVLLRAGLDVPLRDGVVSDSFRIERAVASIAYLRERGAKTIIIAHIGREGDSLSAVAESLAAHVPLVFMPDVTDDTVALAIDAMEDGDVILLENLRKEAGEEANDPVFAGKLAGLADLYINDAFSVSHRAHASIVGVPALLPSAAGLDLSREIEVLEGALMPPSPSLCILGGAKFETKAPLIRALLDRYDHVFVCGALTNDIFRARGLEVGVSRVSDSVPEREILDHPGLLAPIDCIVKRADGSTAVVLPEDVGEQDAIKDMGEATLAMLMPFITEAKFILWNGPTGLYEEGFTEMSASLAHAIAKSSAQTILGGGDTVATLEQEGALGGFSFVSTGGGAMLEYLLKGTLPGIEALS